MDAGAVTEVDEKPELYETGHVPRAVKLHWKDDLQDPGRARPRRPGFDEGRPLTTDVPTRTAQAYLADERDETVRGYRQQMQEQLGLPGHALVDVRSPELRALDGDRGVTPEQQVTAYCRIGERSAHTWFVLRELLGYPSVRNYDGSRTEWGNVVDVPIELGGAAAA